MRRLLWLMLLTALGFAPAFSSAAIDPRATLYIEEKPGPTFRLDEGAHPDVLHGQVTWAISDEGADVTAYFLIADRLRGSIEFVADKGLASASRAMVIRLGPLEATSDPIVAVIPSVDGLSYPVGPRLMGIVSRRDDKTFDVGLDETKAAEDAKAIAIATTIDVNFRMRSGRIGRVSINRDEEAAAALAHLFPPVSGKDTDKAIYEANLSNARAEADAAKAIFGNATSGEVCFARTYDANHLRAHPHQYVASIGMVVRMAPNSEGPQTADRWTSTDAFWSYDVHAVLRNGVGAGATKAKVCSVKRVLSDGQLRTRLNLSACGAAVEDGPDGFSLADDARQTLYSPYDENVNGVTWPAPRRSRNIDDTMFLLDRADANVCSDIARRDRGGETITWGFEAPDEQ